MMQTAKAAHRMPAREAKYRNLVLNQRVSASAPFVSRAMWLACGADVKPIDGLAVFGGLDLSSVADLTAWVKIAEVDGVWQCIRRSGLPGAPGPTVNYQLRVCGEVLARARRRQRATRRQRAPLRQTTALDFAIRHRTRLLHMASLG
jgi:hypothetical protein